MSQHHHHEGCACGHDHHEAHHHHSGCHCAEHQAEPIHAHDHDHSSCDCHHEEESPEHQHHHHEGCSCGHDHEHEHHHEPVPPAVPREHSSSAVQKRYHLKNLGCANCAAKMERKINELEGVEDATITYATAQLRVWAKDPDRYLSDYQNICASIESEVVVEPLVSAHEHSHDTEDPTALPTILIGAVLFAVGQILNSVLPPFGGWETHPVSLVLFVIGYLVLGLKILKTAVSHMGKGNFFDENFLMSLATIGAFIIGEYPEAVGVMLFYRVGEFFEDKAVARSRSNIMEAMDLRPEVVQLITDTGVKTVPAEEVQAGAVIEVRPGDRIPLDGVVLKGTSLVDTSPITGEPVPVSVGQGSSVTSGCLNTSGLLTVQVTQPLESSMVTRILESVENAAAQKPQLDRFITRFSRIYTPIVVALAVLVAIVPSLLFGDALYWVKTACTFLVISCPCALVLSVPLAFFAGIGAGSQEKILFKGGSAMEVLAKINTVILDKTGTITKGNFVLQELLPAEGISSQELLAAAAGCEAHSTHPIAISICEAAASRQIAPRSFQSVQEIAGHGIHADSVLCGNEKLMAQAGISLDQLPQSNGTQVYLAENGRYLGALVIADTIKPGAAEAISKLKELKIHSAMLTGDQQQTAESVAAQVGIQEVRSKLLPNDKLAALQEIRSRDGQVLFVGDGINDAPVLAGADAGAAMGAGADAAIEAADLVFLTGEPAAIPRAIELSREAVSIAKQNVVFALVIKLAVIVLGLMGYANMWAAVFADTGVAMLCVLNSMRALFLRKKQ